MLSWIKRKLSGSESTSIDEEDNLTDQDVTNLSDASIYIQQIFEKGLNKSPEDVFENSKHPSPTEQCKNANSEMESVPISSNDYTKRLIFADDTYCYENIELPVKGIQTQLQNALLQKSDDNPMENISIAVELPQQISNTISQYDRSIFIENLPFINCPDEEENSSSDPPNCAFSYEEEKDCQKKVSYDHKYISMSTHDLSKDSINGISEYSHKNIIKAPQSIENILCPKEYLLSTKSTLTPIKNISSECNNHPKIPVEKDSIEFLHSRSERVDTRLSDISSKYEDAFVYADDVIVPLREDCKDSKSVKTDQDEALGCKNQLNFSKHKTRIESRIEPINSSTDLKQGNNDIIPKYIKDGNGTLIPILFRGKIERFVLVSTMYGEKVEIFVSLKSVYVKDGVVCKCKYIENELEVKFDGLIDNRYHAVLIWIGNKPNFIEKENKQKEYYDIRAKYYGCVSGCHQVIANIDGTFISISVVSGMRSIMLLAMHNCRGEKMKELDLHQLLNVHVRYDPKKKKSKWSILLAVSASKEEIANDTSNWPIKFTEPNSQISQMVDSVDSDPNIDLHYLAFTEESIKGGGSVKNVFDKDHADMCMLPHSPSKVSIKSISGNSYVNINKAPQSKDNLLLIKEDLLSIIPATTMNEPAVSSIKSESPECNNQSKTSLDNNSLGSRQSKLNKEVGSLYDISSKYDESAIHNDNLSVQLIENFEDTEIISIDKDEASKCENLLNGPQNLINGESTFFPTNCPSEQNNNDTLPKCTQNCHGTLLPVFENSNKSKIANLILTTTVLGIEVKIFVSKKTVYVKDGLVLKCKHIKEALEVQFDGHIIKGSYHANLIWIGKKPGCVAKDRKTIEYYDISARYYGCVSFKHQVMAFVDGTFIPISVGWGILYQALHNCQRKETIEKLDLYQLLNINVKYEPKNVQSKWIIMSAVFVSNKEFTNNTVNWPVNFQENFSEVSQIVGIANSGDNITIHPLAISKESDICVSQNYKSSTNHSVLTGLPNCLFNWHGTLIEKCDENNVSEVRKFQIFTKISEQNHDILVPKKSYYFENGNIKSLSSIKVNLAIQFDAVLNGDGYRMLVMWVGEKPSRSVTEKGQTTFYDVPCKYYGCHNNKIHLLLASLNENFIPVYYKLIFFDTMGEMKKPSTDSCLSVHLRQIITLGGSQRWSVELPICLESITECVLKRSYWPDISLVPELFDIANISLDSKIENRMIKKSHWMKDDIHRVDNGTNLNLNSVEEVVKILKHSSPEETNDDNQEILKCQLKNNNNNTQLNSRNKQNCLVNWHGVIRKNCVLNGRKTLNIVIQTKVLGKMYSIIIPKKSSYCENEVSMPCTSLGELSNISFDAYLSGNKYCITVMWIGDKPRKVDNNAESYYYSIPSRYVGKSEKGHHLLSLIDEKYVPVTLRSSWSFFSISGRNVTPTVGCIVYLHMKKVEANRKIKWTAIFSVAQSERQNEECSNLPLEETDDSNIHKNQGKKVNDTGMAYELPKCLINWHGTIIAKYKNRRKNCIENFVITTKIAGKDYEIFVPKDELYFENGVLESGQCLIGARSIEFDAHHTPDGYYVSIMWSGDKPKYVCMEDGEIRYHDILCKYYGSNGNINQLIAVLNGYLIPIELKHPWNVFKVNGKEVDPNAGDFVLSHLKRNVNDELVTWSVMFSSMRPSEKNHLEMFWPVSFTDFKIMHLSENKVLMKKDLSNNKDKLETHIDKIQLPEVLQNCVGTLIPIFCKDNPDMLKHCVLQTRIKDGSYVTHIPNTDGHYVDNDVLRNFSHLKTRKKIEFDAHLAINGDGYSMDLIWVGKKPNQVGKFYLDIPVKYYGFNENHKILAYVQGMHVPIKMNSFRVSSCYSNSSGEIIASSVTKNSLMSAYLRKKQGKWKLVYCVPYKTNIKCSQESISWPKTFCISDDILSDKNNNATVYASEVNITNQANKCQTSYKTECDTDKGLSGNAKLSEPVSSISSTDSSTMIHASSNISLEYNECRNITSTKVSCGNNAVNYDSSHNSSRKYNGSWERLSNMELYINPEMISNAKDTHIVYKSGSFLKFNDRMGFMKTSVNKNIVFYRENLYINKVKFSLTIQNSSIKVGNTLHGQCYELQNLVVIDDIPVSYVCIIAYSGKMHSNIASLIQKWKDNIQETVKKTTSSTLLDSMVCSDSTKAALCSSQSGNDFLALKSSIVDKMDIAKSKTPLCPFNDSSINENVIGDKINVTNNLAIPLYSSKPRQNSSSNKDFMGDKEKMSNSKTKPINSSKSRNDSSSNENFIEDKKERKNSQTHLYSSKANVDSNGDKRNIPNSETLLENTNCEEKSLPRSICNASENRSRHLSNSALTHAHYRNWVRLSNMDLYANSDLVSKAKSSQIITKFGSFVKFNGSLGFMRTILNENIVFHRANLYINRVKLTPSLQKDLMETGKSMLGPCFELKTAVVFDGLPVYFVCIIAYSGEMHSNAVNLIQKWKDGVQMTTKCTSRLFSDESNQIHPVDRTLDRIEFSNYQTK